MLAWRNIVHTEIWCSSTTECTTAPTGMSYFSCLVPYCGEFYLKAASPCEDSWKRRTSICDRFRSNIAVSIENFLSRSYSYMCVWAPGSAVSLASVCTLYCVYVLTQWSVRVLRRNKWQRCLASRTQIVSASGVAVGVLWTLQSLNNKLASILGATRQGFVLLVYIKNVFIIF